VELEAVVGVTGAVTDVRVVRSLDRALGLDQSAMTAVRQTAFVPCQLNHVAVPCVVTFVQRFVLPSERPAQRAQSAKTAPLAPADQFGAGASRPGNGVTDPVRLREVKPVYTPAAKAAGLHGSVELEAVIGIDGAVKDVRVTRSLDATLGLDANAVDAVRQTPFTPCKRGDVPVPCLVVFELHYTLDNDASSRAPFGVGAYTQAEQPQLVLPIRVRTVQPRYTPEAMRAKIEGSVTIEGVVGPDGAVTEARVVKSLDRVFGLDQKALEAVRATPFTPGRLNGVAVPVRIIIELTFTLR
jgi:protein TonB